MRSLTFTKSIANATEKKQGYDVVLTITVDGRDREIHVDVLHNGEIIAQGEDFYYSETAARAAADDIITEDISGRAAQAESAAPAIELPATLTVTEYRATGGKLVVEVWLVENITAGTWRMVSSVKIFGKGWCAPLIKGTPAERKRLEILKNKAQCSYEETIIAAGWKLAWIGENGSVWYASAAPTVLTADGQCQTCGAELTLGETLCCIPDECHNRAFASQSDPDEDDDMGIDIIEIDYGYQPACHVCGATEMLIPHYGDVDMLICPACEATSSGIVLAGCCSEELEYQCSDCGQRLCLWHVCTTTLQPFCWACRNKEILWPSSLPARTIGCSAGATPQSWDGVDILERIESDSGWYGAECDDCQPF